MRISGMLCMGLFFCAVGAGAAQVGKPPSSVPPGPVTLDLNPASGDQGKREVRGLKPGDLVAAEVLALGGARGATGFTVTLTFDTTQVAYEGFEAGALIPDVHTLPLLRGGTLEVGGGQFGKGPGAAQDAGRLGVLRFKIKPRFRAETALTLIRARYRKPGGTQDFEVRTGVVFRR